jgi:hypothetical protein
VPKPGDRMEGGVALNSLISYNRCDALLNIVVEIKKPMNILNDSVRSFLNAG